MSRHIPTCFDLTKFSTEDILEMKDWLEQKAKGKFYFFHEREFQGSTLNPHYRYKRAQNAAHDAAYQINVASGYFNRGSNVGVQMVLPRLPPKPKPISIVRIHTQEDAMIFRLTFNPPKITWKSGKITR